MHTKITFSILGLIVLTLVCNRCNIEHETNSTELKQATYTGRYELKEDLILDVKIEDSLLIVHPSFWRNYKILDAIGKDKFVAHRHPSEKFQFIRDTTGNIVALNVEGHKELTGTAHKLSGDEIKPVELLLSGNVKETILGLQNVDQGISEERIISLSSNIIQKFPSKAGYGVELALAFESKYPQSIDLLQIIGIGSILNKDRDNALRVFQKAAFINAENTLTKSVLRLLNAPNTSPPPPDSWVLPFNLDSLFKQPTPKEINAVRTDWDNRDLSVKNPKIVSKQDLELNNCKYKLLIISHLIHGSRHYGIALIPKKANSKSSPVVVELHGVDPWYTPFKIIESELPFILRENKENAIIVIPSFRGNTLIVKDSTYTSEGSPIDGMDGATDDAISFLNTVLKMVPEADASRIGVFGKSRGGTVALLMGIRDHRILGVIDWAGPVDWFNNMGTWGWTLKEQVQWALWEKWLPGKGWGSEAQFIERYLEKSIKFNSPAISEIRHQIIASSPLYFLDSLPIAQLHYGKEDRSVPVKNANTIQRALALRNKPAPEFEMFLYENTGHDLPYPKAYDLTGLFLMEKVFKQ